MISYGDDVLQRTHTLWFLQGKARIQIWLFQQRDLSVDGRIIVFDEYMNLVLDDAEEVNVKKTIRNSIDH
ncbi:hypothetical protein Nepgr_019419 [Nepenthes gracilis]|uniref:Sm protein E n=1 Tax=Nepenthes gracilis TaxID=150966 RepID=A0AAD3XUC8_NEPGR|nr:hypothetical protein Nepgr_019419 [Nepenthes gracilis]